MFGGDVESLRKDWLISCRDVAGRRRNIIVFTDRDQVVVVAPAGETAVLTSQEVERLRTALSDAAHEAGGQA